MKGAIMFLWVVGLMTSFSLLLLTLGCNTFLVTLPLWTMVGLFAVYWITYSNEGNVDLFCIVSAALTLFVTLHLSELLSLMTTMILLSVVLLGGSLVYIVRDQSSQNDAYDRCANYISKLSFFAGFLLFYGAEMDSTEPWLPLLPCVLFLCSESFIIYRYDLRTYQNIEFRDQKRRDRILNVIAILVLIALITLHLLHVVDNVTLYVCGILVYMAGIFFIRRKDFVKIWQQMRQRSNSRRLTAGDDFLDMQLPGSTMT